MRITFDFGYDIPLVIRQDRMSAVALLGNEMYVPVTVIFIENNVHVHELCNYACYQLIYFWNSEATTLGCTTSFIELEPVENYWKEWIGNLINYMINLNNSFAYYIYKLKFKGCHLVQIINYFFNNPNQLSYFESDNWWRWEKQASWYL